MSNKPNRKKIKSNAPIHWPTVILISGLVVLLIPAITIGLVFLDAFEGTGSALVGNRFANEIQEEISKDQLKQIEVALDEISATAKVDVTLMSATLRVTALVSNETTEEAMIALTQTLMDQVFTITPRELYFTNDSSYKQYDLEVHVFNDRLVVEEEDYLYVLGTLNATMEETLIQVVSNPLDPDVVAQLYQDMLDKLNKDENPDSTEDGDSDAETDEGDTDNEGG